MKLHVEDFKKKKSETDVRKLTNTENALKRASDTMIADDVNRNLNRCKVVAPPALKANTQAQLSTIAHQHRALSYQDYWFMCSPQNPVFRNFRCGCFGKCWK